MVSETITINTKAGFHLRPAGVLSKKASEFNCTTTLIHNENRINTKSVMLIVAECIKTGHEVTFECDGPQEKECLQAIIDLASTNFGEN